MEEDDKSAGEECEDRPEAWGGDAEDVPEPGEVRRENEKAVEEAEAERHACGGMRGDSDEEEGVKESEAGERRDEPGEVEGERGEESVEKSGFGGEGRVGSNGRFGGRGESEDLERDWICERLWWLRQFPGEGRLKAELQTVWARREARNGVLGS